MQSWQTQTEGYPAKRAKLSPSKATSPYSPSPQSSYANSPNMSNLQLPNAFATQPRSQQTNLNVGVMGPPQRPNDKFGAEKQMDVNDQFDSVASSGIDLREEENALQRQWQKNRGASAKQAPPTTNFDLLSKLRFGTYGTTNHGSAELAIAVSEKTLEEETREKQKAAARTINENAQYHLTDPFLFGAVLRKKLESTGNASSVKLPVHGLFDRIGNGIPQISRTSMSSANEKIEVLDAPSILNRDVPLDGIISLLCLAANERLRGVLEDAYGASRGRRLGSDGIVPSDFTDLALPEHETGPSDTPKNAQDSLHMALNSLTRQERLVEETRKKLRAARRTKRAHAAAAAVTTSAGSAPIPSLPPGMIGEKAPEIKMTKKEQARQQKQDLSDEMAVKNANDTAVRQLGGRNYSWMTAGPKKPAAPAKPAITGVSGHSVNGGLNQIKDRKFGLWRENSTSDQGVEMRDLVLILESDGREKGTLEWATSRMDGLKFEETRGAKRTSDAIS